MNIKFINEVRASLKRCRTNAIRFRHDDFLRKHSIQQALSMRRFIRDMTAIYG
ncbi:hypothetical protein Xbed_03516 [Xenorhabdus beddingii]|uniref:Uncharacterized protein n=1 Tax=Xenorhabdus beddingii TaxID=40578 RepID=A0A1Y2SER1_9GAMM|nr:hypothetical protein [Xenorhabdus beddingii]OTA16044.1 hypothetical protein Xbed_03516 [Xenorhabdus beddingii]